MRGLDLPIRQGSSSVKDGFWSSSRFLLLLAGALSIFFVASAIWGGVHSFSPVPFWDMWDGYLEFYLRLLRSDWSVWWGQSNEHRIFFARILFWLDFKLFNGGLAFLIVCNYLLVFLASLVFWLVLNAALSGATFTRAHGILMAAIVALLFSWTQAENFTWAYQSQFFMAQLVPFVAFYFLFRSLERQQENKWLLLAIGFGIASAGTMANGVLALPCMAAVALILNVRQFRGFILVALSIAVAALYFHNYQKPPQHSSPWLEISEHGVAVFRFVLAFLGSPFVYVIPKSLVAAQVMGGLFLAVLSLLTLRIFGDKQKNPLLFCLLGYEAYLVLTALITAGGRASFGLEYAVSSRYTTPALMAWCALSVALIAYFHDRRRAANAVACVALALVMLLAPNQTRALQTNYPYVFERMIAALALEMGVNDSEQIKNSYYAPLKGLRLANRARRIPTSIFANPLIRGTREQLAKSLPDETSTLCAGHIDDIVAVPSDSRFMRVSGWIYQQETDRVPRKIFITDESGKVVGVGLSGQKRTDLTRTVNPGAGVAGVKGYLLASAVDEKLHIRGVSPSCEVAWTR